MMFLNTLNYLGSGGHRDGWPSCSWGYGYPERKLVNQQVLEQVPLSVWLSPRGPLGRFGAVKPIQ